MLLVEFYLDFARHSIPCYLISETDVCALTEKLLMAFKIKSFRDILVALLLTDPQA